MELTPSGDLVMVISTDSAQTNSNYKMSLVRMNSNGNFWTPHGFSLLP
ncbi:MAG: hypothetical protein IPK10_09700 [Bacteroidetes bacterium]|nr:hypothetical protein [Bacteroidota bacterium]